MKKLLLRSLAVLTLALGLVMIPSVAQADTIASIAARCGSGYTFVASVNTSPQAKSKLYVFWNNNNGYNCAILDFNEGYENQAAGWGEWVEINSQTGGWDADTGDFSQYAGPVYVYANNTCIWAYGYRHNPLGSLPTVNTARLPASGWGYCD